MSIPFVAHAAYEQVGHLHESALLRLDFFHTGKFAAARHAPLSLLAQCINPPLPRIHFLVEVDMVRISGHEPMIEKLVICNVEAVLIVRRPKVIFVDNNTSEEKVITAEKPVDNRLVEVAPIRRS